jgi:hypothetical protein
MTFEVYLRKLQQRGLAPKEIKISEWNAWTAVSCFDFVSSKYISESVSMGIDKDTEIALWKALTEFGERKLAKECPDLAAKLTRRSDGFAAFPVKSVNRDEYLLRARENAHSEAIERFLWAHWWDDNSVFYELQDQQFPGIANDIDQLIGEFDLKAVREIRVPDETGAHELSILVAETKLGGFFTGGACSRFGQDEKRMVQAFGELLRHLFAYRKIRQDLNETELGSFYEKRLFCFGSGIYSELVRRRLMQTGTRRVRLPQLIVDQELSNPHRDLVALYRCLFAQQPTFMGGKLERLCI